jgi:hypothetical protein
MKIEVNKVYTFNCSQIEFELISDALNYFAGNTKDKHIDVKKIPEYEKLCENLKITRTRKKK